MNVRALDRSEVFVDICIDAHGNAANATMVLTISSGFVNVGLEDIIHIIS